MSEIMQSVCVYILVLMVVMLSLSQDTNGISDHALGNPTSAPGPISEKGLLPNPVSCVAYATRIPDCVQSVKHFRLKEIKKECCIVLLGLTDDCFGMLFPMRFVYRIALKATCKILGVF